MMENLKQFLTKNRFSNLLQKSWKNLSYLWADYNDYSKKKILSKYLLCPFSINEWLILHQDYDQFVTDVVEPIYYELHSDICWNLYFIVIVSNDDFKLIDYHTRYNFEINTEYTRNLIITDSQICERLPVGHVLTNSEYSSFAYPVKDWLKTLGDDFPILETLSADCFQQISSMCGIQHPNVPFPSAKSQHELILSIEHTHIPTKFREHFYRKDLDIACRKVNLFVGANGTGKTSVLSAIELAMTGSVRKHKPDSSDLSEQINVSVTLKSVEKCEKKFRPLSLDERKNRAIRWYNYTDNCTMESLNSLFHCINYFSVDTAYRFVTSSPETSNILSKTIFGSEVLMIWHNLQILKTKCQSNLSELHTQQLGLENQLASLNIFEKNPIKTYGII